MNPYDDAVLYDFPMPYNGVIPPPAPAQVGGGGGAMDSGEELRRRRRNMALAYAIYELLDDEE